MNQKEREEYFKKYQELENKISDVIFAVGQEPLDELNGKTLSEVWICWQKMRETLNNDWLEFLKAL